MRFTYYCFLVSCFLWGSCYQSLQAQATWEQKISPEVWMSLQQQTEVEYLVVLKQQVNTQTPNTWDKATKGQAVWTQLKQQAATSQAYLLPEIQQHTTAWRSFFIVNAIWVKSEQPLIEWLAKRPEVATIAPNPRVRQASAERLPQYSNATSSSARAHEWGIERIGALRFWQYQLKGSGVVIGGQDTGVDWEHPALKQQYRGDSAQHNYHWHDAIHQQQNPNGTGNPCGYDATAPCDDGSHGTYTMGIAVGDDGLGNQVGVAPEASWIACRNMDQGWGTPASYIECFEWFLAPTDTNGQQAMATMAPHVITNSWNCPPQEGCNASNFALMETAVNNLRNAGIVVVVAAGNDGASGCNSIQAPAGIFEGSFVVGATDIQDSLANFSSRGSILVDSSGRMKPNVVAPGAGIRSTTPNGGYTSASGTSAAAPNVVGAVALMINAVPSLAGNVDSIERLLEMTADTVYPYRNDTCGGIANTTFPNNHVGYGRINLDKVLSILRPDLDVSVSQIPTLPLNIYPNPTENSALVELPSSVQAADWRLVNTLGQVLQQGRLDASANLLLSLQELPVGLYWFQLQTKEQQWLGKILKE